MKIFEKIQEKISKTLQQIEDWLRDLQKSQETAVVKKALREAHAELKVMQDRMRILQTSANCIEDLMQNKDDALRKELVDVDWLIEGARSMSLVWDVINDYLDSNDPDISALWQT